MKDVIHACRGMSKKWKNEEEMEMGMQPCSKAWLKKEMKEPWHKSLHKKKMDTGMWAMEEGKEKMHRRK